MDGGAWWAAVHGVTKRRTRLSDFPFIFHFHALEKEMATHSSVLAWRIPGTGEPGGLPPMGSHRVGHNGSNLAAAAASIRQSQSPSVCAWVCVCARARTPCRTARGISVLRPRIESVPSAVEVWSLNHWTAREVPNLPVYPSLTSPLATVNLFATSVTLFLFCKYAHLYHFLDSMYKWYHKTFVFLWLTSLRMTISRASANP